MQFFSRFKYTWIAFFFCFIFLAGSTFSKNPQSEIFTIRTDYPILELDTIPQANFTKFVPKAFSSPNRPVNTKQAYFAEYFKAWTNIDMDNPNLTARAAYYLAKESFDETLKPYSKKRLIEHIKNANAADYNSLNQLGIITQNTDLRSLPTVAPRFENPQKDRGSYPFDLSQDDFLYIGTPVRISHLSKDKAFTYIQIPGHSEGWVRTQHVVKVTPFEAQAWR